MPKKSSLKKAKEAQESPVDVAVIEKEKKSSSELKKTCNEIDEIFSSKKRKKLESEKTENVNEDDSEKPKEVKKKSKLKKKKSRISEEDGFAEPPSRSRKRTNDGLAVYTAEELGIGKGDAGGTPLCPFDCSCCF